MLTEENCPFCGKFLDVNAVIWEGKNWRIFYNKYPYTGTSEHIMAVPKSHKKFSTEFTAEEWAEMSEVHNFVKNFYGEKLYFSFTRENFISETADGRSVEHWHMHFLPGSLKGKFLRKMLELQ